MKYNKLGKTDLTVSRVSYGGIVAAGVYSSVTYPSEGQDASKRYVAWAIEQYDENGEILRSSGPLGYIYGKEKIERIIKLLPR